MSVLDLDRNDPSSIGLGLPQNTIEMRKEPLAKTVKKSNIQLLEKFGNSFSKHKTVDQRR